MRVPFAAILLISLASFALPASASTSPQAGGATIRKSVALAPVADLARRVVPWLGSRLVLIPVPKEHGEDVFDLQTLDGKLVVRASSPSSAAMGLNYYLKYYCHRSMSHVGNNLASVKTLPLLPHPVHRTSPSKYRYLLNYCTLNYTLAFADWKRWERELDWMALSGVNLALATTGTEAVWQNALRRLGYSESEILDFIPGPAYTAWWLMGNLEGWGGPVTQQMIDQRVTLEKKILGRMRELGIEPVMQGFYGMVPASLVRKFPDARILEQGQWGGFRRPRILLSSDPLFTRMAAIYYEEIRKLYGQVRFYGGDLFHEGGITTGLDLTSLAAKVQDSMVHANPDAVWVLQGWQGNPKQELLDGLSAKHVLILNMDSDDWEKRKGFGGLPWVWGIINNFGEKTGLSGDLHRIAAEPIRARKGPYGSSMVGVGALMEGIDNNPAVYDLVFDIAWRDEPVDLKQWVHDYVLYRYGVTTPELESAWTSLLETTYKSGNRAESIFCARPSLSIKSASTWGTTRIDYDPAKLQQAASEFLQARGRLSANDAYQYDAVNIVRQVLANRGLATYPKMVAAYAAHDRIAFDAASAEFLDLIRTEDSLLASRPEFLLGRWLAQAKSMGNTEAERLLCEKNARTQITYWGPDDPATDLHDYAHKEWSGLLKDFYLPRWEMFVRDLDARLDGKSPSVTTYFDFEKKWSDDRKQYPVTPSGDAVEAAAKALDASHEATK